MGFDRKALVLTNSSGRAVFQGRKVAASYGFESVVCSDPVEALIMLEEEEFDSLMVDDSIDKVDLPNLLRYLRDDYPVSIQRYVISDSISEKSPIRNLSDAIISWNLPQGKEELKSVEYFVGCTDLARGLALN